MAPGRRQTTSAALQEGRLALAVLTNKPRDKSVALNIARRPT